MVPQNLAEAALEDFAKIINGSRDYGAHTTKTLQTQLLARFEAVAEGRAIGHVRSDATFDPDVRFINLLRFPFVIVYDQQSRIVLRIIHGRRDFRALILDKSSPA